MIVLDPTSPTQGRDANGWTGAYVTNDFDRFEACFWASRRCLAIIDEAADVLAENANAGRMMFTRGRHLDPAEGRGGGQHVVVGISQRHIGLPPSVRFQCNRLFAFQCSPADAEALAVDWNCPALLTCPQLPPLHYWYLERHGRPVRGIVTLPNARPRP